MTKEKKSLVEEALFQMKNLENVVTENAKGILASTMKEEIEELVKESLEETEEELTPEESLEMEQDTDISMSDMGDEDSMEMSTMTMDDESGETDFEEMGMEDDEIEPLDMTQASDDELLKVILGMGDDDRLIVQKSGDEVDVDKLTQTDSMSFPMGGEDEEMSEPEFSDEEEEIVYEIEISDDEDEEDEEGEEMNESMTVKPKGVGMGKAKSEIPTGKVNMKGFKDNMKQHKESFKGPKKFEFKEGEEHEGEMEESEMEEYSSSKKHGYKNKHMKAETKEAARTYGNGSRNYPGRGLPKMKVIPNSALQEEVESLRAKNEEYRKALNIFREKLNEVAVFNSNLAYATRLFTEHTTTKQEKINIMRRFDNVETIKESKNLYSQIKNELGSKTNDIVKESIVENIDRTPSAGSTNLIESKTYENPQFLRMKDLMSKLTK